MRNPNSLFVNLRKVVSCIFPLSPRLKKLQLVKQRPIPTEFRRGGAELASQTEGRAGEVQAKEQVIIWGIFMRRGSWGIEFNLEKLRTPAGV